MNLAESLQLGFELQLLLFRDRGILGKGELLFDKSQLEVIQLNLGRFIGLFDLRKRSGLLLSGIVLLRLETIELFGFNVHHILLDQLFQMAEFDQILFG